MEGVAKDFRSELERIQRVSDMLASAHAHLRGRYAKRAVGLDLALLASSTWLVAVVFIEPKIGARLSPPGVKSDIWLGLLTIISFFFSVVQLRVDWKGRSDAHKRSFDIYAEVKRECGYLLRSGAQLTKENCERVLARYDLAAEVGTSTVESEFLKQKSHHLCKVEISRRLDTHPAMSISLFRIRIWWRDNFATFRDN
jgi:hypothetical protein